MDEFVDTFFVLREDARDLSRPFGSLNNSFLFPLIRKKMELVVRYHIITLSIAVCAMSVACYGIGRANTLASQLRHLEAQNQFLIEENVKLKGQIELAVGPVGQNSDRFAKTLSSVQPILKNLIQQYGTGFEVAQDLGLPEMQNFSKDELEKQVSAFD